MKSRSITTKATLTIREVAPELKEGLRVRAAFHGRSMEAELRVILSDAVSGAYTQEINLADPIQDRFRPLGGIDLTPHPPVPLGEPPEFKA